MDLRATVTPAGLSATFDWTFGDGATYSEVATGVAQVAHSYAIDGTFLAKVFVRSSAGDANASVAVTSATGHLSVDIQASPLSGGAPLTVHLVADVTGGTGTYTAIQWRFGDGDNGSGSDLEYTYSTPGTYDATVNATDSAGAAGNASVVITVLDGPAGLAGGSGSGAPTYTEYALPVAFALAIAAALLVGYRAALLRRSPARATPDAQPSAPPVQPPEPPAPAPTEVASPLTPESMGEGNAPANPLEESRRLSERILIHLYWYGRPTADGVARADSSQGGMSRRLGVGQNTLSKALQRLIEAGLVTVELRHVPGAPRRLRTYALTPRGEGIARSMRADPGRPPAG